MAACDNDPASVQVAIIDDHDVVHAGIQAWCASADPPITVAGSFYNPRQYFARYPTVPNDEVDVLLFELQIDARRPDWESLATLCNAGVRVVVYSHMFSDEVILTSLEIGALTYLVKSEGQHHLVAAVHSARSGEPYAGPRMTKALINDNTPGRTKLSEREKEVLVAWFQTESKELVGKRLFIAPTTVRTHLQRARVKYAAAGRPARTKSALLARAIEDGILSLSDL